MEKEFLVMIVTSDGNARIWQENVAQEAVKIKPMLFS